VRPQFVKASIKQFCGQFDFPTWNSEIFRVVPLPVAKRPSLHECKIFEHCGIQNLKGAFQKRRFAHYTKVDQGYLAGKYDVTTKNNGLSSGP